MRATVIFTFFISNLFLVLALYKFKTASNYFIQWWLIFVQHALLSLFVWERKCV